MPILGGIIMGGLALAGSVTGDVMSSDSAAAANEANIQATAMQTTAAQQRQQEQETYNAQQANIARTFSAQQVQQQEAFQEKSLQEVEQWNEQMSNTAMQRRVADLKAAGINPLLAVSQGGASAPTMSPLSGNIANAAQASGGITGTPGAIPMQNTGAAWGNLGGQMSSAMEAMKTGASIDLMKAQANKLNTESGTEIPAQVQYLQSMTGLNNQNAQVATQNAKLITEQIYKASAETGQVRADTWLTGIKSQIAGQQADIIKATRDALISSAQSDATARQLGLQGLRNLNQVQQGRFGQAIATLNAILQPVSTAAHAAGAVMP